MVYVDDMRAPFGRMIMCHMVADTHEELMDMARTIGMQAKWLQHAGTYREHFDISLQKKKLAIEAGAKLITRRELGQILANKRNAT